MRPGVDPRSGNTYDGSARLCFDVEPPFTRCFLIENNSLRAAMLDEISRERRNAEVIRGDVNERIAYVLRKAEPQAATFAFLDPEGTELHWSTVRRLAEHKRGQPFKVELLILFPLQMCVLRLLNFKTGLVPKVHEEKLEQMLGAESPWRDIWRMRLLGEITTPEETRAAFLDAYCHQLKSLGYAHVLAREVVSDDGRPLYYLVFASDHDAGKRIMRHEFAASQMEPGQLFNAAEYTTGVIYDPDEERPYRY